jgi:hypothetical protein
MHSNGLPGGRFSRSGRSSLKRLHRLPVIALIRTRHPVRSEELFETLTVIVGPAQCRSRVCSSSPACRSFRLGCYGQ